MLERWFATRSSTYYPGQEASIRTLSVSLLAVAAIAASLLITRTREDGIGAFGEGKPAEQSLDAIRAAGL
jgi:hypothetical protein